MVLCATGRRRHVTQWENGYEFRPGRWAHRDFNFETPSTDLTATEKTLLKLRRAELRTLRLSRSLPRRAAAPADEDADAGGRGRSPVGMLGASNYARLATGGKFTLADHPCEKQVVRLRDPAGAAPGDRQQPPGQRHGRGLHTTTTTSKPSPTTCHSGRCA